MATKLEQCGSCGGFLGKSAAACPHCGTALVKDGQSFITASRLRLLGGALGGAAVSFTLMACYGAPPPCPDGTRDCHKTTEPTPTGTGTPTPSTDADAGTK